MKTLIILALFATAHGYGDRTVRLLSNWQELFFGGFSPPGYGLTHMDEPRIIGGSAAQPGQYPHQVSLQISRGSSRYHTCGGSIISATKIATAAHCCQGQSASTLKVVAGAQNVQTHESTQQVMGVSQIIKHPQYNHNRINYDGCKLILTHPLQLNNRVQTIPLCTTEPTSGVCTATGWGTTSTSGNVVPTQLQQVNLEIIPRATCQKNYQSVNTISQAMLCAGGREGQSGCNGDSGGPLVCTVNGSKCLAGATSWGMQPCAQKRYPTVYANVAHLHSFYSS